MYSKYGVGLVFILLPLVLLGKALAFLPGITEDLATGFLISFYNIPFASGTLWLLYGPAAGSTSFREPRPPSRLRHGHRHHVLEIHGNRLLPSHPGLLSDGHRPFPAARPRRGHIPGIGLSLTHRDEAGQCRARPLPPCTC